jgi:HAD superfamily hydrolase (TIGR01459 family)
LFHLGPERDRSLFADLAVRLAAPDEASHCVCTGLVDDLSETPESYAPLLRRLAERGVPMICANPDRIVMRGDRMCYCAGALAEAYEALGGAVAYAGKPHGPIYALALSRAAALRGGPVAQQHVIAVGDGLATDIAGAAMAGIDCLFVAAGLHGANGGAFDQASIASLFAGQQRMPIAAIEHLAW